MTEVPDAIDIVILNNRPEARSLGAGEPATRPVAAAIANALFDATGSAAAPLPAHAGGAAGRTEVRLARHSGVIFASLMTFAHLSVSLR
jgi:hypothetical protein